jgi:hypothetical protein
MRPIWSFCVFLPNPKDKAWFDIHPLVADPSNRTAFKGLRHPPGLEISDEELV